MEIDKAIELLDKATALLQGNRQDHIAIQTALQTVKDFVAKNTEEVVDGDD